MQNARDVLTPDSLTMLQVISEAGSFAAAARQASLHGRQSRYRRRLSTHSFKRILNFACYFFGLHHRLPFCGEHFLLSPLRMKRRQFLNRMAQSISVETHSHLVDEDKADSADGGLLPHDKVAAIAAPTRTRPATTATTPPAPPFLDSAPVGLA